MQVRKNRLLFFTLIWYLLAFLAVALPAWAQPNETTEWTWMGGSSAIAQPGVYGTMGSPAGGNIPGNRVNASSWNDGNRHLWLFGGYGTDSTGVSGYLNDLWEFNPSTNEWTWMNGSSTVPCAGCAPAAVFGTVGTPAAGNVPGGRSRAASWIDSNGNFWLLVGESKVGGFGGVWLDDLWEFNPSTNEWTWLGGGAKTGQTGVYGTPRTPAAANFPGSRWMLPVGPTAVAASGSSASGAMMLPETLVISMTFGSSTLQPTSGRE